LEQNGGKRHLLLLDAPDLACLQNKIIIVKNKNEHTQKGEMK